MINFLGQTDLRLLTNVMTDFIPVVGVVDFYWPDTVNECPREGHLLNGSSFFPPNLALDLKNYQDSGLLSVYQLELNSI